MTFRSSCLRHGITLLLAAGVATTPARAADQLVTVSDYLANSGSPVMRGYLSGLAEGYLWANTAVTDRGDKPIFCQPDTVALSTEDDDAILRAYVAGAPDFKKYPLGGTMIFALQQRFPCRDAKP